MAAPTAKPSEEAWPAATATATPPALAVMAEPSPAVSETPVPEAVVTWVRAAPFWSLPIWAVTVFWIMLSDTAPAPPKPIAPCWPVAPVMDPARVQALIVGLDIAVRASTAGRHRGTSQQGLDRIGNRVVSHGSTEGPCRIALLALAQAQAEAARIRGDRGRVGRADADPGGGPGRCDRAAVLNCRGDGVADLVDRARTGDRQAGVLSAAQRTAATKGEDLDLSIGRGGDGDAAGRHRGAVDGRGDVVDDVVDGESETQAKLRAAVLLSLRGCRVGRTDRSREHLDQWRGGGRHLDAARAGRDRGALDGA